MSGTYKITAVPVLHSHGNFKGKLKGVSFTAVSPTDTKAWLAGNCGQFEMAFSRIMPSSLAKVIIAALTHGDEVELPGMYAAEQFEREFLFEWSPVHLVVPPQFVHERAV
jgi:hypothetical protein